MGEIMKIDSVQQYNDYLGVETLHPLVSVVDCSEAQPVHPCRKLCNVYAVVLKDADCGQLKYGQTIYDYHRGSMLFLSPGQILGSDNGDTLLQPEGWALVFHPELLYGTHLAREIRDYSYFAYNANEALHLSEQERHTVIGCMQMIRTELQYPADRHSRALIVDNIKLLLDHCVRFYDRQFIMREPSNCDVLARFERLLDDYFLSDKPATLGTPSVQYCADELHLSASYFSDLVRKETGESALKHIRQKMLDMAKAYIADPSRSISETAYDLGFQYPQHFSRWFKGLTGISPNDYRNRT